MPVTLERPRAADELSELSDNVADDNVTRAEDCFKRRRNGSERRTAIDPIISVQTKETGSKALILNTMRPQQSDGPQYTQR